MDSQSCWLNSICALLLDLDAYITNNTYSYNKEEDKKTCLLIPVKTWINTHTAFYNICMALLVSKNITKTQSHYPDAWTHTHTHTSGYEWTDKVFSQSAPSTSDMQKIVMPDLFDMKRWDGNNCREWMIEMCILGKKAWKGTTERQRPMCSTSLQHADAIKSAESCPPYRQRNVRVTAGPFRTVNCAEVLLGHN